METLRSAIVRRQSRTRYSCGNRHPDPTAGMNRAAIQGGTKTMAMDRATLEGYLREAFPDAEIALRDLAGDNDHWSAEIVSEQFRGKSRVAQHQMVYAALKGRMGGVLHALALTTRAPE